MPFMSQISISSLSFVSVLFSLFILCFSICSLLSSDPNTILLPTSTSTSHTILHRWSFTKPLTHFHCWSFTRPLFHLSSHCSSTDSPSPISVVEASHDLSHISLVQSLHRCWVLDFGFWRLDQCGSASWIWIDGLGSVDRWVWIGWLVGLKQWICWSVGGSIGLIIGSSNGGSGDDFFLNGFASVVLL